MTTTDMGSFLAEVRGNSPVPQGDFLPVARYYKEMDLILYLTEDCSYVADRLSAFLTILWHPYEKRLVGVKIKGCRFIFEQLKELLNLRETDFMPFVKVLRTAFMLSNAELAHVESNRRTQLAELFAITAGVSLPSDDQLEKMFAMTTGTSLPPAEWRIAA
jgi:hypothetical protein